MGQRPLFFHRETVPHAPTLSFADRPTRSAERAHGLSHPACPGPRFRFSDVTLDNGGASTYN